MMMQVYWVPWSTIPCCEAENPRPAQFVFASDDDTTIRGFVSEVDHNLERTQICLFESTELELPNAELVYEKVEAEDVSRMLRDAFDTNPEMAHEWGKLLNKPDLFWNN